MDEIDLIKKDISALKERNMRVAAEKAWERSGFRALSIMAITYVVAGAVFITIRVSHPWRNALIPTIAYFLSTQSLPFLKKKWIKRYLEIHPGRQH